MTDVIVPWYLPVIILAAALFVIIYILVREGRRAEEAGRLKEERERAMFEEFYRKAKDGFEEKKREERDAYYKELLIKSYAEGRMSVDQFDERMKTLDEILSGGTAVHRPSVCPACGAPTGGRERCEYCGLRFT